MEKLPKVGLSKWGTKGHTLLNSEPNAEVSDTTAADSSNGVGSIKN
jgi:hypothetical protein